MVALLTPLILAIFRLILDEWKAKQKELPTIDEAIANHDEGQLAAVLDDQSRRVRETIRRVQAEHMRGTT